MKERFWLMDYNALVRLVYDARRIATDKGLRADVSVKGEADFVTAVDTGISAYIKEGLNKIAPGVAFVTEEEAEHISVGERFVLDPIDGTTNLMRGYNVSSISLGYYADGEVRFGVVYDPFTNKMFFAVKGLGAHFYDTRFGMDRLTRSELRITPKIRLRFQAFRIQRLSLSSAQDLQTRLSQRRALRSQERFLKIVWTFAASAQPPSRSHISRQAG